MTKNGELSADDKQRYNRQLILPGFGTEAQVKLKNASVLVIGAGGLGSPLLLYLAAAGVGHIGLVEYDQIALSNLHRQVIFDLSSVGKSKAQQAKTRMLALNPDIEVRLHECKINAGNAADIIASYDVVADGSDNFPTRYVVNDTCVSLGKALVYGAVYRFEGQVSVFNYCAPSGETGPNYRDFFPLAPSEGQVPSCSEGGVLGVLPGIIGAAQANEVIKVITGIGSVLSGRVFHFDALHFETHIWRINKRLKQPLSVLQGKEEFAEKAKVTAARNWQIVKSIDAQTLRNWQITGTLYQLIDVRRAEEVAMTNINGASIPLADLIERQRELSRTGKVVLCCQSGTRSKQAIQLLQREFGFDNLFNLEGGIAAYTNSADQ